MELSNTLRTTKDPNQKHLWMPLSHKCLIKYKKSLNKNEVTVYRQISCLQDTRKECKEQKRLDRSKLSKNSKCLKGYVQDKIRLRRLKRNFYKILRIKGKNFSINYRLLKNEMRDKSSMSSSEPTHKINVLKRQILWTN